MIYTILFLISNKQTYSMIPYFILPIIIGLTFLDPLTFFANFLLTGAVIFSQTYVLLGMRITFDEEEDFELIGVRGTLFFTLMSYWLLISNDYYFFAILALLFLLMCVYSLKKNKNFFTDSLIRKLFFDVQFVVLIILFSWVIILFSDVFFVIIQHFDLFTPFLFYFKHFVFPLFTFYIFFFIFKFRF